MSVRFAELKEDEEINESSVQMSNSPPIELGIQLSDTFSRNANQPIAQSNKTNVDGEHIPRIENSDPVKGNLPVVQNVEQILPVGFRIHHKWYMYTQTFISIGFLMEELFQYSYGYPHRITVLFDDDQWTQFTISLLVFLMDAFLTVTTDSLKFQKEKSKIGMGYVCALLIARLMNYWKVIYTESDILIEVYLNFMYMALLVYYFNLRKFHTEFHMIFGIIITFISSIMFCTVNLYLPVFSDDVNEDNNFAFGMANALFLIGMLLETILPKKLSFYQNQIIFAFFFFLPFDVALLFFLLGLFFFRGETN